MEELELGQKIMVVGGFTKNNGSIAMAERSNISMILTCTGKDISDVLDNGKLTNIEGYCLIFTSIGRKVKNKTVYELVMLIIGRNHEEMKIVRDYILESKAPKEKSEDRWDVVGNYGVKYYYMSSYEKAITQNETPDTFHGVRSLAVYNISTELSVTQILEEVSKYVKGNVLNVQFEEKRDKDNELVSDMKKSARRIYAYIGKVNMEITKDVVDGLRRIMEYNSRYDDQVLVLTTLPFWTTTRFYYAITTDVAAEIETPQISKKEVDNSKVRDGNVKVINSGRGGRDIHKNAGKEKEVIRNNNVQNRSVGRDTRKKWGEVDELKTSINEDIARGSKVVFKGSSMMTEHVDNVQGSNDMIIRQDNMMEWQQRAENNILSKVMSMMNDNNKEIIEETNKNIDGRLKENNSLVMKQLRKDKEEHDTKMEQMMQMQSSVYAMMMQMQPINYTQYLVLGVFLDG